MEDARECMEYESDDWVNNEEIYFVWSELGSIVGQIRYLPFAL